MKKDTTLSVDSTNKSMTAAELTQKHLKDPNHHVTDEELRNVRVGIEAEDEEEVSKDANQLTHEIEDLSDAENLPNPYRIIE